MATSTRSRLVALTLAAAGVGTVAAVAGPAPGSAVAATTNLQASVAANGSLASGSRVTATTVVGPGQVEVTFDRDVSGCAYLATTVNGSSQAVQAYTAGGHLSANGVFVETKNQGGGLGAAAFDLVVVCDAGPFSVVGYGGQQVRGSTGARVVVLGAGRYEVVFPTSVAGCAPIATVGDPAADVVFNPSGVSTGVGRNARTVYVETKNPGGGLQAGVPFHLAVLCAGTAGVSGAGVRADGVAASSFGDLLSFRSAAGRYTLVTRADVSRCATVATRSSLTRAVPYQPTTIETAASPAANTVALQVRTLLAGGGTYTNQSFTTAVVC